MPATLTSASPARLNGPRRGNDSRFDRPRRAAPNPAPRQSDRPPATEHAILFQQFFKSVGPRTYAAQVKRAGNGNHYLVLTEGQRVEASPDVRKTRLFVYSEDFVEFFRLVKAAAEFIKAHPLPENVQRKREKYWAKQAATTTHTLAAPAPSAR